MPQHFTMNPACPHPDQDGDLPPQPLAEAIAWAVKVLRDPAADQWTRCKAADELAYSHDCHEAEQ